MLRLSPQGDRRAYACVQAPLFMRRFCMGARKLHLSKVFAGQNVGVRQVADQVFIVSLWTMT